MVKVSASATNRPALTSADAVTATARKRTSTSKRAAPSALPSNTKPQRAGAAKKNTVKKVSVKKTASTKASRRTSVGAVTRNEATPKPNRKAGSTTTPVHRTTSTAAAAAPRRQRAKAPSPDETRWVDTLRDGTQVLIRAITKNDDALERAFIKRLSPQSRRLRFLGQIGEPSDKLVRSLTDIDWRRDAAFIALVHREGEKREIGVSRYSMSPDGKSCECAVTVDDEWHGRGLAVALMRHLTDLARSRGITTMFSIDAAGNQRMRDLARFLGFERKADPNDVGQVIHALRLTEG